MYIVHTLKMYVCILFFQDKYRENFYYIAPLYHLAFQLLDRAVFIDASDLEFTIDIRGKCNSDKIYPLNQR